MCSVGHLYNFLTTHMETLHLFLHLRQKSFQTITHSIPNIGHTHSRKKWHLRILHRKNLSVACVVIILKHKIRAPKLNHFFYFFVKKNCHLSCSPVSFVEMFVISFPYETLNSSLKVGCKIESEKVSLLHLVYFLTL